MTSEVSQHIAVDDPKIKRVRRSARARSECRPSPQCVCPLACTQDIVCLVLQYLQDEGYTTTFLTMQDESKVKLAEKQTQRSHFKRMRKFILGAHATAVWMIVSPQP